MPSYRFLGINGGVDLLCHCSAVMTEGYKCLKEDDEVKFDFVEGETAKPQADKAMRLDSDRLVESN
jgi:cold shock CspA family protein